MRNRRAAADGLMPGIDPAIMTATLAAARPMRRGQPLRRRAPA